MLNVLFLLPPLAAQPPENAPTISPDELVRGQIGTGWSVFAGTEPEPFEVEVVGVQRGTQPESAYILAYLRGKNLEHTGVAAGMSGSPVYFDGKLAGAVSFSYLFAKDALAGITPIEAMHVVGDMPGGAAAPATALQAPSWKAMIERKFDQEMLEDAWRVLRPSPVGVEGANSAIVWSGGGFSADARQIWQSALGTPLHPAAMLSGGESDEFESADLGPGDAVAMLLVGGDMSLAAHGTVTDRRGDEIFAFGHPAFGFGAMRVPMAHSEVVTVVASTANSFKVSNAGPVVGLFDQDRTPGVRGLLGRDAPSMPMTLRLRGPGDLSNTFEMQFADLPQMRPTLLALTMLGGFGAHSRVNGNQSVALTARFELAGYGELISRQNFDGGSAAFDSVIHVLGYAAWLELNDQEDVEITNVEIDLEIADEPRLTEILGARADRRRVAPGDRVGLWVDLKSWRGEPERERLEIEIPEDLPDGTYSLIVGDGTTLDAVRLAVEQRAARNFGQALDMLRKLRPNDQWGVVGLTRGGGLSIGGEALPSLPGSVRSVLAGAGTPLGLTIQQENIFDAGRPLSGAARVDLTIERR